MADDPVTAALSAERERITREAQAAATVLVRPGAGNGPGHAESHSVVPLSVLQDIIGTPSGASLLLEAVGALAAKAGSLDTYIASRAAVIAASDLAEAWQAAETAGQVALAAEQRRQDVTAELHRHLAARDRQIDRHRAEQDSVLTDLGELLDALGTGSHARPESPHQVMQQAIAEVRKLRGASGAALPAAWDGLPETGEPRRPGKAAGDA